MLLDAHGKNISLYSLLGEKPLIILPVYTKCPSICGVISNGAQVAIRQSGKLGKDFNVISFSFDSTDTSLDLENYQRRWHLDSRYWRAVSSDRESIRTLMNAIGFEFDVDTLLHQFNHPALMVVITPEGRISRYIYGVNPSKRDIRLAVIAAMAEKTSPGLFSGMYLRCFGYDPLLKTYTIDWRFIISTSAGLLMIVLVTTIFVRSFITTKTSHGKS